MKPRNGGGAKGGRHRPANIGAHFPGTEIGGKMDTKLCLITQRSARDPDCKFDALLHHVYNEAALADSFHSLDGKKAVGVDGIRKEDYAKNLEGNIRVLASSLRSMGYRPRPVRERLIPKEGKPGATRPLGISCFEDKMIQKSFADILEAIYEPLFLDCSYGFRPGRSCHDAIKQLDHTLYHQPVSTIVDIDIKAYFDTIDHENLMGMLELKISDRRFLRYISRMLKAGVLSKGELRMTDEGTPQGSLVSPILSNIYLHHVHDKWFEEEVKRHCRGNAWLFRYADDILACFEYEEDARGYLDAVSRRMEEYGLTVNREKSKIVHFSRRSPKDNNGPFDFLGFTFYMGKSREGRLIPKVKTSRKKYNAKLRRVKEWIIGIKDKKRMSSIWKTFSSKIRGHIQYYGVSFNLIHVRNFLDDAVDIIYKWLNRRSQRKSFSWEKFRRFTKRFPLPRPCIVHQLF
jgi:RNA-directed DNA polymerase